MEQDQIDQLNKSISKMNDELYEQTKQAITHGHRLPYKEYVRERAIYYVKVLAATDDVLKIKQAVEDRLRYASNEKPRGNDSDDIANE